ncbi:hypothetical protein OCU04_010986 [Sclerotinia nivalis]|uniref:Uncharacterized protein n=1 Tax=Sclerotinia nivalis TaxID=352851 RepID=A0A9X0AD75_9HELO|nr:hypothetical protein OCU04_010986 [Sclerotinia nivalis]
MTSTSSNSPTSLPTTIAFILNRTTDDYFCSFCTTNQENISIPIWIMSVIFLIFVLLLKWLIQGFMDVETCHQKISTLEHENIARWRLLEDERKQSWVETYQQDAARMVKIRDLAASINTAFEVPYDTVDFEEGYAKAATFIHEMNQLHDLMDEEFLEKYCVDSSRLEKNADGIYIPPPKFGPKHIPRF